MFSTLAADHLPVRLAALAPLLSPALRLFGQQGQQVDGDGAPILPVAQVVHQTSREGKVADAGDGWMEVIDC